MERDGDVQQPAGAVTTPQPGARSSDVRHVYWSLLAIAVVASALLALLWGSDRDTLAYEAAKGCIGILTVALVGFVVSIGVQTIQRAAADEKETARESQANLQREVEQQREEWRREVERLRDERQRKDAVLRSLLDETLDEYHRVKRARRMLKARVWREDTGDSVDLDVYDEHLATINDAQLKFELLMRTVDVLHDGRVEAAKLRASYRGAETYLNQIVTEYEKRRRLVAHSAGAITIGDLPALQGFIQGSHAFVSGVSTDINMAITALTKALCAPLEIPQASRDATV